MCPDPGVRDPLDQLGVLVYQPSLPQYVGGGIFKLKHEGEAWPGWVVFTVYEIGTSVCHICTANLVQITL